MASDTPGSWLAGRRMVATTAPALTSLTPPANPTIFRAAGHRAAVSSPRSRKPGLSPSLNAAHTPFGAALGSLRPLGAGAGRRPVRPAQARNAVDGRPRLTDSTCGHRKVAPPAPGICCGESNQPSHLAIWKPSTTASLAEVQITPTSGTQRAHRTPLTVRVIDYSLDDGRDNPSSTGCRPRSSTPLTLLLPKSQFRVTPPALGNREHLRRIEDPPTRPRAVLRPEVPAAGQAGNLGHLCCHFAIDP